VHDTECCHHTRCGAMLGFKVSQAPELLTIWKQKSELNARRTQLSIDVPTVLPNKSGHHPKAKPIQKEVEMDAMAGHHSNPKPIQRALETDAIQSHSHQSARPSSDVRQTRNVTGVC
jgi:hypothetical protein